MSIRCFANLYSQREDQCEVPSDAGKSGSVKVIDGHFPEIGDDVRGSYDQITSKNMLKTSFFNP